MCDIEEKLKVLEIEYDDEGVPLIWVCPHCAREYHEDYTGSCNCNLDK